jgi:hypothetical protein
MILILNTIFTMFKENIKKKTKEDTIHLPTLQNPTNNLNIIYHLLTLTDWLLKFPKNSMEEMTHGFFIMAIKMNGLSCTIVPETNLDNKEMLHKVLLLEELNAIKNKNVLLMEKP